MAYSNTTGLPSVTDIISPNIDTSWFTEEHCKRGSAVHSACEAYLKGVWVLPLAVDYQPYFESFKKWADLVIDEVVMTEERLSMRTDSISYCGQFDAMLRLKGGSADLIMADWKTSQAYQVWWRLQGAAYIELARHNGYKVKGGMSVRTKKDGSGCLINWWPDDGDCDYNTFVSCYNVYKFFNKGV